MFRVIFYQTADGHKPAGEFVNSLDAEAKRKVVASIHVLEHEGPNLRYPDSEILRDEIFQLRIPDRAMTHRMLYFFVVGETIVVTNGFTKKTPKTPPGEIERAKKYREDYLKRH